MLSVPRWYASAGDEAQQVEQILVAIMTREGPSQEADPGAAAVRRAFRDATGAGSTEFLRRARS